MTNPFDSTGNYGVQAVLNGTLKPGDAPTAPPKPAAPPDYEEAIECAEPGCDREAKECGLCENHCEAGAATCWKGAEAMGFLCAPRDPNTGRATGKDGQRDGAATVRAFMKSEDLPAESELMRSYRLAFDRVQSLEAALAASEAREAERFKYDSLARVHSSPPAHAFVPWIAGVNEVCSRCGLAATDAAGTPCVSEPAPPAAPSAHVYGDGCTTGHCAACGTWHCMSHLVSSGFPGLADCPLRAAPRSSRVPATKEIP